VHQTTSITPRILSPEFLGENLRRHIAWVFTYQFAFISL